VVLLADAVSPLDVRFEGAGLSAASKDIQPLGDNAAASPKGSEKKILNTGALNALMGPSQIPSQGVTTEPPVFRNPEEPVTKARHIQRAAASPLSSGRVLKAMAA
jgi:hypothetical protein